MKRILLYCCVLICMLSCSRLSEKDRAPEKKLKALVYEGTMDSMGVRRPSSFEFFYAKDGALETMVSKSYLGTRTYDYFYTDNGLVDEIVRTQHLDTSQKVTMKYTYEQGELVSVCRVSSYRKESSRTDLEFDNGRNTRFTKYYTKGGELKASEQYLFQYDRKGNIIEKQVFYSKDEGGYNLATTFSYKYDNKNNPLAGYRFFESDELLLHSGNNIKEWTRDIGGTKATWEVEYTYEDGYPVKGIVPGDESLNRTFTYY